MWVCTFASGCFSLKPLHPTIFCPVKLEFVRYMYKLKGPFIWRYDCVIFHFAENTIKDRKLAITRNNSSISSLESLIKIRLKTFILSVTAFSINRSVMCCRQWISQMHCFLDRKSHIYCAKTIVIGSLLMDYPKHLLERYLMGLLAVLL